MKISRMKQIFEKIGNVKVAVCGDFCLDIYWELDPAGSEVSLETGIKAQAVREQRYFPGGAGNVVSNVRALNPGKISAAGIIGDDIFGGELLRQFAEMGVDTGNLLTMRQDFQTHAYCKRILDGKELERVDFGIFNRRSPDTDAALLKIIPKIIDEHDAFIFNQQIPNSITNEFFIEKLNEILQNFPDKIIIVDSRHYTGYFRNVILKMNEAELARLNGIDLEPGQRLRPLETKTLMKLSFEQSKKPIFVTRSERGIVAFDGNKYAEIPGVHFFGELDPVGAGDTVVSTLACSLAAEATPYEAAELANYAAAVVVKKIRQTGSASPGEIIAIAKKTRDH